MLATFLVSFMLALLGCGLAVRHSPRRWHQYPANRPQRFHGADTPRLGGLVIAMVFLGVGCGGSWVVSSGSLAVVFGVFEPLAWWTRLGVVILPALIVGVAEDLTHAVAPRWRLLATSLSGLAAIFMLDLRVERIDVAWLDSWMALHPLMGILLAWLAVAAMPHAINLIDGYNGLAATFVLLAGAGLAYVALKVQDWHVLTMLVCLLGVTAGFWFWNYPRGLLFAGDGGAYFWGVVLAIVSLALVLRNPEVSPWFPVVLLAYPIMETVLSVYRKWVRGQSPSVADALHFHQLVYRRLVRGVFHDDQARRLLMRNNRTSPYLWAVALVAIVPAIIFWWNTPVLVTWFVLFMIAYVGAYLAMVRFKVPKWLRR